MFSKTSTYYIAKRNLMDLQKHKYATEEFYVEVYPWYANVEQRSKGMLQKAESSWSKEENAMISSLNFRMSGAISQYQKRIYEKITKTMLTGVATEFSTAKTNFDNVKGDFISAKQEKPTAENFQALNDAVKTAYNINCEAVLKGLKEEFNAYNKPISATDIAAFKAKVTAKKGECSAAVENSYSASPLKDYKEKAEKFHVAIHSVHDISNTVAKIVNAINYYFIKLKDGIVDSSITDIAAEIAALEALQHLTTEAERLALEHDAINSSIIPPTMDDVSAFNAKTSKQNLDMPFDIFLGEVEKATTI